MLPPRRATSVATAQLTMNLARCAMQHGGSSGIRTTSPQACRPPNLHRGLSLICRPSCVRLLTLRVARKSNGQQISHVLRSGTVRSIGVTHASCSRRLMRLNDYSPQAKHESLLPSQPADHRSVKDGIARCIHGADAARPGAGPGRRPRRRLAPRIGSGEDPRPLHRPRSRRPGAAPDPLPRPRRPLRLHRSARRLPARAGLPPGAGGSRQDALTHASLDGVLKRLAAALLLRKLHQDLHTIHQDLHTIGDALTAQNLLLARLLDYFVPTYPDDRETLKSDTGVTHLDPIDAGLALDFVERFRRDIG